MLLLEDDKILTQIVKSLANEFKQDLITTDSVQKALIVQIKENPELVITDYHLGAGQTSITLLESLRNQREATNVTVYSSDRHALRSLKKAYSDLGWNFIDKNQPDWPQLLKQWIYEKCSS